MTTWTHAQELFAAALPGYEARKEQTGLAETIEGALARTERLLAQAGCGCIQGDAEIVVNRGGNSRRMTMRHLVTAFNGGRNQAQQRRWDPAIPTYVQREVEGTVRLGRVLHAWSSGVKTTYTVTTETGRTLRATDEHPFLTERGWLRLDELKIDDELHVRGEQTAGVARQPKPVYRRICVLSHPYRNGKTVPKHRLVAEADLNELTYSGFFGLVRDGKIEGLKFLDPEVWAVHHKDHDSLNNDLSNLQVMTHEEHHRLHAAEGKTNSVLFKIATERVVSVEKFGEEETYDIEVADDPHNFLVNGIVVHNTGKSFAALVPAIDHAQATGTSVVVATATKALQTQYAGKDLPFLAKLYADDGRPFTFAVIKGRGSYVCAAKLDEIGPDDVAELDALKAELATGDHSGDFDDIVTPLDRRTEAPKLATGSDECPGKNDCPFGDVCFAEAARRRAAESDVVVANHSLVVVDSQIREKIGQGILPDYEAIVVDEAHELVDYTTSALGKEFTQRQMSRLGADAARLLEEPDHPAIRSLQSAAPVLFTTTLPNLLGRKKTLPLTNALIAEHGEQMVQLWEALDELRGVVQALKVHGDDRRSQGRKRMLKRINNLMDALAAIVSADSDQLIRWVEREERMVRGQRETSTILRYAPLRVGPFLDSHLWNTPALRNDFGEVVVPARPRAAILMSATLTTGGNDFSFIADELGVDLAEYEGFDAGTPFDFPTQAGLYVPKARTSSNPKGFADPSKETETWRMQAQQVTRRLVLSSGGRALLLFTSREAMTESYNTLAEDFEAEGIRVLMQGQADMTNKQLAEVFREDETSVLFALKSFMTGADFQGRTLQLVIVDKLPFAVPTDVIVMARNDAADRAVARDHGIALSEAKWHRKGSFNGRTIPAAILTLMQALGRGVRTKTDRALLVVLDPRISPQGGKNYRNRVLAALPAARRIADLPTALDYLAELDTEAPLPA